MYLVFIHCFILDPQLGITNSSGTENKIHHKWIPWSLNTCLLDLADDDQSVSNLDQKINSIISFVVMIIIYCLLHR